jgi:hypothetical protein
MERYKDNKINCPSVKANDLKSINKILIKTGNGKVIDVNNLDIYSKGKEFDHNDEFDDYDDDDSLIKPTKRNNKDRLK